MPWIVSGGCNHCGICCYSISNGGFMLENPMIELGQERCKFYTDDVDTSKKYGHCLVMRVSQPKNAKDIDGNKIIQEQIDWFNHNCPVWPKRVKDLQQLLNGLWGLPDGCGFHIEEVP